MKKMLGGMVFLGLIACDPSTEAGNDVFNPNTGGTSGGATAVGTTGGNGTGTGDATTAGMGMTGDTTGGITGETTGSTADPTTGGTTGSDTGVSTATTAPTTGGVDGGTTGAGADGGTTGPVESMITGTAMAAGCMPNTAPANGMCGGWYCGTTEAQVAAELVPGAGPCSDLPAADVCAAKLVNDVSDCAVEAETQATLNILDPWTDEERRMYAQDCVYGSDPAYMDSVSESCMGCFLDAAECAGEHCLTACLINPNSEGCVTCRLENGCDQAAPTCAGLPSPF